MASISIDVFNCGSADFLEFVLFCASQGKFYLFIFLKGKRVELSSK